MTFYLPQFFCPKILAQNTESFNGKQYVKIGGIERTFKERSLEKLRFGSEHVIAQVIRKCILCLKLFGATVIAWPFFISESLI